MQHPIRGDDVWSDDVTLAHTEPVSRPGHHQWPAPQAPGAKCILLRGKPGTRWRMRITKSSSASPMKSSLRAKTVKKSDPDKRESSSELRRASANFDKSLSSSIISRRFLVGLGPLSKEVINNHERTIRFPTYFSLHIEGRVWMIYWPHEGQEQPEPVEQLDSYPWHWCWTPKLASLNWAIPTSSTTIYTFCRNNCLDINIFKQQFYMKMLIWLGWRQIIHIS